MAYSLVQRKAETSSVPATRVGRGVSVKFQRFDGVVHEFFGLAGAVSKAADAVKFAAEGLQEVFELKEKSQTN